MRTALFTLLAVICLPFASFAAAAAEGQPAPPVSMRLLKDGRLSPFPGWQAYKGKVVVLEFWATWCEGCVANIPRMNDLEKEMAGKPVVFVSVTGDDAGKVRKFLETHRLSGLVAVDAAGAVKAFGANSIPMTVVLDRSGRVARFTIPELLSADGLDLLLEKDDAGGIPALVRDSGGKKSDSGIRDIFSVSVTSAPPGGEMSYGHGTAGPSFYLEYEGLALKDILADAYGLCGLQVEVSTALPDVVYDFKVLGPRSYKDELKPLLIQTLKTVYRADMRLEKKTAPVYLLKYYKAAPPSGLKPARAGAPAATGIGYYRSAGAAPGELAKFLESLLGRPVLDRTGLTGFYDVAFKWKGDDAAAIMAAVKEQLGLTLEPSAAQVDVLEVFPAPAGK